MISEAWIAGDVLFAVGQGDGTVVIRCSTLVLLVQCASSHRYRTVVVRYSTLMFLVQSTSAHWFWTVVIRRATLTLLIYSAES